MMTSGVGRMWRISTFDCESSASSGSDIKNEIAQEIDLFDLNDSSANKRERRKKQQQQH